MSIRAILQTIFVQSATLLNFLSRAVAELAVRVKKINRDRLQDESESCATIWSISNVLCQKKSIAVYQEMYHTWSVLKSVALLNGSHEEIHRITWLR